MVTPRTTHSNQDVEAPPPKPPRTGSTSPSDFLSLERGEYLREDEYDDDYDDEGEEDAEGSGVWIKSGGEEEMNGVHAEDLVDREDSCEQHNATCSMCVHAHGSVLMSVPAWILCMC